MTKILIVGFGASAYSALMALKKSRLKTDLTIIDPKNYDLFHPCGLPYSLEGIIDPQNLAQSLNLTQLGAKKITGLAQKIKNKTKEILVKDFKTGQDKMLNYDSLLLATGAIPNLPPIEGVDQFYQKKVFTLTKLDDLLAIKKLLPKSKKVLVVGGGAIGLETAVALKKEIPEVKLIEKKSQILSDIIEEDLADLVKENLQNKGIEIKTNSFLESIEPPKDKKFGLSVHLKHQKNLEIIDFDLVILATGVKPNLTLAHNSNLASNQNGFLVNEYLQTSDPNIFAVGDNMANWSVIDNKPLKNKLATAAYQQGKIAGSNFFNLSQKYLGSAATFVSKIGNLEVAGTGYKTTTALALGYKPVVGQIKSDIFPEYFPQKEILNFKIIADATTKKILGAQAIAPQGAASRINLISLALEFKMTLDQLKRLEMAYCPAVSEVDDPLLRSVDFALRRIKK